MSLIAKPSHTVEVAELLARLAKAELVAREEYETGSASSRQRDLEGELAGLRQAARITRELADWPVEADSDRGMIAETPHA